MGNKSINETIKERRSVRTFDGKGVSEEEKAQLIKTAEEAVNPYGIDVETRVLDAGEHGLKSPVIAGADTYVAMKLERQPHFEEALGYSFEKFCLDAWELGFGTTIIGGTMNRPAFEDAMALEDGQLMPVVTPIGRVAKRMSIKEVAMRKGVGADKRRAFGDLFFSESFERPLTAGDAGELAEILEMVRLAPSAVNKQPWRLVVSGNKVHFYLKPDKGFVSDSVGDMQKIDMGIAICHFCLAAAEKGMETKLEIADPGLETAAGTEYIATIVL